MKIRQVSGLRLCLLGYGCLPGSRGGLVDGLCVGTHGLRLGSSLLSPQLGEPRSLVLGCG